jgi:hypothetical protein
VVVELGHRSALYTPLLAFGLVIANLTEKKAKFWLVKPRKQRMKYTT